MTVEKLKTLLEEGRRDLGGCIKTIDLTDESCDGGQKIVAHYVPIVDAMKAMFADPYFAGKMTYEAMPMFQQDPHDPESSNRTFGAFQTGQCFNSAINSTITIAYANDVLTILRYYISVFQCWHFTSVAQALTA